MSPEHDREDPALREDRALDELVVAALRGTPEPTDLSDLEGAEMALTEDDRRVLDALGPGLVERLLREAGPDPRRPVPKRGETRRRRRRSELAGSLHRDDGLGDVEPEARAEMERKVREIEADGEEGGQP